MQEQQQRFRHILQHLWEPKATSNNPKLLSIGDQASNFDDPKLKASSNHIQFEEWLKINFVKCGNKRGFVIVERIKKVF
jgi:hypothetical protein